MKDKDIAALDFSAWPLPDTYLIEIGRVSTLWASLETLLNICLGKLAGFNETTDPKPFIMLAHASFPQKLDMLGALCEQLVPVHKHLNDYKDVIGLINSAKSLRNKFAHYGMSYNEELKLAQMVIGTARGSLKTKVEDISVVDIRKVVIAIDNAQRSLYKLVLKRDIEPIWKRRTMV